jgi:hypothetical protein
MAVMLTLQESRDQIYDSRHTICIKMHGNWPIGSKVIRRNMTWTNFFAVAQRLQRWVGTWTSRHIGYCARKHVEKPQHTRRTARRVSKQRDAQLYWSRSNLFFCFSLISGQFILSTTEQELLWAKTEIEPANLYKEFSIWMPPERT